jgi:hypothetical protein
MIRIHSTALCASVLMALTACGGGDGANTITPSAPTLTGLAATGAAITNAPVTARCLTGDPLTGTTDPVTGVFILPLSATHTAPCMLEVVNGTTKLYSVATAAGRVNITPATDLVVANALKGSPEAVFAGFNKATSDSLLAGLAAAKTYVKNQLKAVTGVDYTGDPIADVLVVGDADDQVLDKLGAALLGAKKFITDLRTVASEGTDLSTILPKDPGTGGTLPTCNTSLFSAGVRNATAQEVASFGTEYIGEAGTFNDSFEFQKTGSVSLALSAAGALTVNAQAQTVTSVCMETGASQLVVHFGTNGHVDLKAAGKFNGVLSDGTVIRSTTTSTPPSAWDWGSVTVSSTALAADRVLRPNLLPTYDLIKLYDVSLRADVAGRDFVMRKSSNPLQGNASVDSIGVKFFGTSGVVSSVSVALVPDPSMPLSSNNYAAICTSCNGVTVNLTAGTVTFVNTELTATQLSGSTASAKLNGTYRLPNYSARSGTTVTASGLASCAITSDQLSSTMSNIACLGGTYVGTGIEGQACTMQIDIGAQTFRFDDGVVNKTFTWTSSSGYTNLASYRLGTITQSAGMKNPSVPLETMSVAVSPIPGFTGATKVSLSALHAVGGTMTSNYDRSCTLELGTVN